MKGKHVIAVDLGAESGRVMRIGFDEAGFHMEEGNRFPNKPVWVRGTLHWDVLRLWGDISEGIKALQQDAAAIGLDAWGVDFALLDKNGRLVSNPVHYRDSRTDGMLEWMFERISRRDIFDRTGIQFMQINTLYQIASLLRDDSAWLDAAATYLSIPDLFNYWLTGVKVAEFSHATTTQFYNPLLGGWDSDILTSSGIPTHIFPEIVQPGAHIGNYEGIPVIAPACHDTGSAVVAVPTTSENYAYLSSGTWSLLGLELNQPVINEETYTANLTNEGGVFSTFRLLKNIMGLWLAQQCRATWLAQGSDYGYEQLAALAESAAPFRSLVDPDHHTFLPPGDMPSRIRDFCRSSNQPLPETPGEVMRAVYESLALKYRHVLGQLCAVSGRTVDRLHIIGGGSKNALLCQMTADAIGQPVVAGPVEATALGNAMVQWIALGKLSSLSEARGLLNRTSGTRIYEPRSTTQWEEHYQRFKTLLSTE